MAQACFQCERVDFARIVEREILVFGIVLADEHGGSQQLPDLMVAEEFAATVQHVLYCAWAAFSELLISVDCVIDVDATLKSMVMRFTVDSVTPASRKRVHGLHSLRCKTFSRRLEASN